MTRYTKAGNLSHVAAEVVYPTLLTVYAENVAVYFATAGAEDYDPRQLKQLCTAVGIFLEQNILKRMANYQAGEA
jgi:hypothetical protein